MNTVDFDLDLNETQKMTVANWIAVPDNPRQRNTARHAKRAIQWLSTASPAHLVVHAAKLPDGGLIKLDGHTRAYLWEHHQIPVPHSVRVQLYRVHDVEEAVELYTHFDNAKAAETARDRVYGAMRETGLEVHGTFLAHCNYADALRRATSYAQGTIARDRVAKLREYELIKLWFHELQLLDAIDPDQRDFPGPLVTAFVMTVRRRSGKAEDFWLKYKMKEGFANGRERDAVQVLLELMMANRATRNKAQAYDLTGRAISTVEAFIRGDFFTGGVKITRPEHYLPQPVGARAIRRTA